MIADQLKKAILQAAIQGKLTEQFSDDGDTRDLLEEINAEKGRLINEGKIKNEKPLPEITDDEIPFDIPDNWYWVRLSDLGMIVGGGTPKTGEKINWVNGDIPWLTPADMKNINGKYVKNGERFITNYGLSHSSAQLMPKGAVLFSSRAPIGYLAIADNPICTNQGFKSVVPYKGSMSEFIYFYLMAFTQEIQKLGSGTTFKEVSGSIMKKLIVPVPPLAEQHRIVDKLDEILPEIESLSVDETKLDDLQQTFPTQMRSSILQAAIQGKLTEQLPEDGDARDLLEEIKAEKVKLIKEGKIKKEKPLADISEDEIPFDIPENWSWVRLGDVTDYGSGKQVRKEKIPPNSWILELEDIEKDCYILLKKRFDRKPGSSKNRFLKGEVLYGKLRPYLKKVIIADEDGFSTTEIIPFKSYGDLIIASYLKYFMVSPSTDYYVNQITHGMDMPRLGTEKAIKLIMPLPPLAEQHRIVARLEELLPLCDALE